ncbi:arylamine N-acetyltransferase family protein [Chryseobacterium shigense]|uniref:N-hydroxyarylamine O-acetyltransferase n=1 Tax=Chryseobacterium shigense TaxID=297244 RepID=A0A841N6E3_9FLAO|nr:arylamine N-acetyltransferase [Chryseobacterium shigense]MBB6370281.1 N-hydroxyarylamine O-acetyltransferase [Chryseobacterium shigense]
MENNELDLYFKRIEAGISLENTGKLQLLKTLHQLHPKHIVFENIDSFTGETPSLQLEAIFNKLVKLQRGGYCYEQNLLFKNVLESLGFNIKMHLARVVWGSRDGTGTARSHMLLSTDINGTKYLADVGFGSMTLTSPILLEKDIEQETPNGLFRLVDVEGFYRLEVLKEEWLPIYKFTLEEVEFSDLAMANWYIATGPDSVFNKFLMITKVDEDARYALFNTTLNIRWNNGRKESSEIIEKDQLAFTLKNHFNLHHLSDELSEKVYKKLKEIPAHFNVTQ